MFASFRYAISKGSYRWGKELYSLPVQIVKFTFLLADLNLYPYPYFQTDNSKSELELHKSFAQLKLSSLFTICMNPQRLVWSNAITIVSLSSGQYIPCPLRQSKILCSRQNIQYLYLTDINKCFTYHILVNFLGSTIYDI